MVSSAADAYGDPKTRQRLLRATWELIEEQGAKPGLAAVADRAGVSRQAIYLHFGGRTGLLVALVQYMDEVLELDRTAAEVLEAPSGADALERMVRAISAFAPEIEPVARVLEAGQYEDDEVAAAWRDRMRHRYTLSRAIIQRVADEGRLAEGWTVDAAADLCYTITMPGLWRALTRERGWTADQYADGVAGLLRRSFVAG